MHRCAWTIILTGVWIGTTAAQTDVALQRFGIEPATGCSKGVVVGPAALVYTSQIYGDAGGRIVAGAEAQAKQVLENLEALLAKAGDRLVKLNFYVADAPAATAVRGVLKARFTGQAAPAVSFVEGTLARGGALVAADAVAATAHPARAVERHASMTALLPAGRVVYISGQAERGTLADATRKTMQSLSATLRHLGLDDGSIVQLKAFVDPIGAAAVAQQALAEHFRGENVPPVVFVEWQSAGLPIEIELVAWGGPRRADAKETVVFAAPPHLKPSPVYSRVAIVEAGRQVFLSTLYAAEPGDAAAQVHGIFATLRSLLEHGGSSFRHLAKATYYVADDPVSRSLNELRPQYYDPQRPPAASKAMVRGVARSNRSITIDMIAVTAEP